MNWRWFRTGDDIHAIQRVTGLSQPKKSNLREKLFMNTGRRTEPGEPDGMASRGVNIPFEPIPVPWKVKFRLFRTRVVPAGVFLLSLWALVILWRGMLAEKSEDPDPVLLGLPESIVPAGIEITGDSTRRH